jgi:hypothetical protein
MEAPAPIVPRAENPALRASVSSRRHVTACEARGDAASSEVDMTRRDDVGEILEGDGTEDTLLDGDGDNTGDAGDRYRGSLLFGTTAAEQSQGESLDQLLAEEEPNAVDDEGEYAEWSDRGTQREIAQLVAGGESSHSRTDPDLVGPDRGETGLSAEEAALHVEPPSS